MDLPILPLSNIQQLMQSYLENLHQERIINQVKSFKKVNSVDRKRLLRLKDVGDEKLPSTANMPKNF